MRMMVCCVFLCLSHWHDKLHHSLLHWMDGVSLCLSTRTYAAEYDWTEQNKEAVSVHVCHLDTSRSWPFRFDSLPFTSTSYPLPPASIQRDWEWRNIQQCANIHAPTLLFSSLLSWLGWSALSYVAGHFQSSYGMKSQVPVPPLPFPLCAARSFSSSLDVKGVSFLPPSVSVLSSTTNSHPPHLPA